jgi:hypothetical protein
MKKIIFTIGVLMTVFLNGQAQNMVNEKQAANESYVPLTEQRFNEIEDLLSKRKDDTPILIKEVPREELIKFYISFCNDYLVSEYMDNAYKRLTKANQIEIGSSQDKSLKRLMNSEQNRSNIFKFLTILNDKQIELIGY